MISCIISFRKIKGPGIPLTVLEHAPGTCNIYVVSRERLITNSVNALSNSGTLETFLISITSSIDQNYIYIHSLSFVVCLYVSGRSSKIWLFTQSKYGSFSIKKLPSGYFSDYVDSEVHKTVGTSTIIDPTSPYSQAVTRESSLVHSFTVKQSNHQNTEDGVAYIQTVDGYPSLSSPYTKQVIFWFYGDRWLFSC